MKISYNWLKEYLDFDYSPQQLGDILTQTGLEVERVEKVESVKGGLEGLVVGEIVEVKKHPNADRLNLTQVNVGGDELLPIVCGAPNVAPKQKVVVAPVGTTIFPTKGDPFKIQKAKIRGEVSRGMICAEDEIGLGTHHDTILTLEESAEVGAPVKALFDVHADWSLEIGLTPNRTDAISHFGVARDLKAYMAVHHNSKQALKYPDVSDFQVPEEKEKVRIEVENAKDCPRYAGVVVTNVKVGPSPKWLENRLQSIGLSPINNVVDITNYVMHEMGQPLHAFDWQKISNKKVVVKKAKSNTTFTTLDGVKRKLTHDDLMICNGEKEMCIAGVFGGLNSGVSTETTSVFLESAVFDSKTIRLTAKHHGLSTDASFRFERGVDPEQTLFALKRAALLIAQHANGKVASSIVDLYPEPVQRKNIRLDVEKLQKLIGKEIPLAEIQDILEALEIEVVQAEQKQLELRVPTYRLDVTRTADVVEEVLRIYGYDRVEASSQLPGHFAHSGTNLALDAKKMIAEYLTSQSFNEIISNSLTRSSHAEFLKELDTKTSPVEILNPLSKELNALRQSLLFDALAMMHYNQNRQIDRVRGFEFGKVYGRKASSEYFENQRLLVFLKGPKSEEHWNQSNEGVSVFALKGIVEQIFEQLGLYKTREEQIEHPYFTQALAFIFKGKTLATMGPVHPELLRQFELKPPVMVADLDWDAIASLLTSERVHARELSKFPMVRRDLSMVIDRSVSFQSLEDLAYKMEKRRLKAVELFDVYEDDKLGKSKKSYALRFTLLDEEKTLTDNEIEKIMQAIQGGLQKAFDAELRS